MCYIISSSGPAILFLVVFVLVPEVETHECDVLFMGDIAVIDLQQWVAVTEPLDLLGVDLLIVTNEVLVLELEVDGDVLFD